MTLEDQEAVLEDGRLRLMGKKLEIKLPKKNAKPCCAFCIVFLEIFFKPNCSYDIFNMLLFFNLYP